MASKVASGFVAAAVVVAGYLLVTSLNKNSGGSGSAKPDTTNTKCVRKETKTNTKPRPRDDGKFWVTLIGKWEGCDDATISWSVGAIETRNNNLPGQDLPCCYFEQSVLASAGDLILLHVTPTNGEGTTFCSINKYNKGGRPKEVSNPNGGPVQCSTKYEN